MTEISILQMKSVRFEGEHCDSECDFLTGTGCRGSFDCNRGYEYSGLEWDEDKRGRFIGAVRSEYCINEFGLFGEAK